jgi:hypothetical protein
MQECQINIVEKYAFPLLSMNGLNQTETAIFSYFSCSVAFEVLFLTTNNSHECHYLILRFRYSNLKKVKYSSGIATLRKHNFPTQRKRREGKRS